MNRITNRIKENGYAVMAFFIPMILMTGIMIALKCKPFGSNSFMIVDAVHQYLPFFSDYQNKLKEIDPLFYSWNGGMGYNFYSLWAYYLSSPLNLLIAVVPKLTMITVINWIIAIKFSLCSLTGFLYFTHRQGKQSFQNLAFGFCYAFSSYMTGYYWNVMWLEVMILLPVILIGMDKMMKEKKPGIYCLALFASLFCNYYMSFMVCIFLVLWFFTYSFENWKDFLLKGIRFAWYSIVAALMAAIVLLPAYLGLMDTSAAKMEIPEWKSFFGEPLQLFITHLVGVEPYNMSVDDSLGNLYCGILPVLLFVLYVIDQKLPWREKLKKLVILVFIAVSFQSEALNYIWHGFHDQHGIPNRFAFIYILLMLSMAYDQLLFMDYFKTKRWKIFISTALLLGGIGYCYQQQILDDKIPFYISAGLLAFYMVLLCAQKKHIKDIICFCLIAEVLANAGYGFYKSGQIDCDYYFGDTKAIGQIVEQQKPAVYERMELTDSKMLDESIWYNMPTVTMFGSTALGDTVDAMDQFGFYTGVNEYLYQGGTPVTDALLGVKSLLLREEEYMNRSGYKHVVTKDGVRLYQNDYPSSIGYAMSEQVKGWQYYSGNPFDVQNEFVKNAYYIDNVFDAIYIEKPAVINCSATDDGNGGFEITRESDGDAFVRFVFDVKEDMDFYFHFDSGSVAENTEVFINGESRQSGRLNSQIVSAGNVKKGDIVTVAVQLKEGDEGNGTITMRAAKLNPHQYKILEKKMNRNKVKFTTCSSTKLEGSVAAEEDGILFFGIPYDKGWTVTIDGQTVATEKVEDGFLSVPVKEGNHTVYLKYQSPGFALGWKLSLLGVVCYFFSGLFARCKKRFRKNSETSSEDVV